MSSVIKNFGEVNFGHAELGHAKRTNRLVSTVNLMRRRPGGSLPHKLNDPKDLKGFYRLMKCETVTHDAILEAHRQATQEKVDRVRGPVLVIHDATELDFTTLTSLSNDLGQIGNGSRRGYIVQNSLAVEAKNGRVIGLYNQVLHHRVNAPKGETIAQKRERDSRESLLWLQATAPLPGSEKLVDVCDQGADTFEFLENEVQSGRRFVIRAAYNRGILVEHETSATESGLLRTYARTIPEAGTWSLRVTSKVEKKSPGKGKKKGKKKIVTRKARDAKMAVSFAPIQIKPPSKKNGRHGNEALKVWVVRVWEKSPPKGQERLEWFLVTNEPVRCFEDAYRVVGWYERRWIIEEYHKGMKTGSNTEGLQFTSEERLQPAIAVLSVVTLTLLYMRDASRRGDAKQCKAIEIISEDYIAVLSMWRHKEIKKDWTIHEFFYALARLGGHQNRKSDHPPGWQIIWRGWNELQAMVCGYQAMAQQEICG